MYNVIMIGLWLPIRENRLILILRWLFLVYKISSP